MTMTAAGALVTPVLLLAQAHAAVITPGAAPVFVSEQPFSWINAVAQVGFPIVVSIYLLWMLDKRLVRIMQILERLTVIMGARADSEKEE